MKEESTCEKCGKSFETVHGLKVHKFRAHAVLPAAPKETVTKRPYNKQPKKVVVAVPINFCPCCGNRIPNAFVMAGGAK